MKKANLPYVRFYMSDWLAATRGMKAAEVGTYFTLLALMYERGEPLPEQPRRLARQCGLASPKVFSDYLETLIEDGKIVRRGGGLWNNRVEKEFEFREKNSEQSSEAASARWGKSNKNNDRNMRPHSDRNATAMRKPEARSQIEKRDTNVSPKKRAGERLSADWLPSQADIDFAKDQGLADHDIEREAAKFRDYWLAKTGQGATKLDWAATWRNWVRNAPRRPPGPSKADKPMSNLDRFEQAIRLAEERENEDRNRQADSSAPAQLRIVSG